jgi:hypothetical protein
MASLNEEKCGRTHECGVLILDLGYILPWGLFTYQFDIGIQMTPLNKLVLIMGY